MSLKARVILLEELRSAGRSKTDLEEQGNNQTLGKGSMNPIMTQVLALVKLSKISKVDETKVWSALLNQRWLVLREGQFFMNPFDCIQEFSG